MKALVVRGYELLIRWASSLQSLFLLIVRVAWGWQFHHTGAGKLHNLGRVTEYFTSLGIPAPSVNAAFIAGLEFLGGLLLILGLGSRLVALLMTCNMLVAFWAGDHEALLSIFSDPDKLYAATPYTFLFASVIILLFGPGKISLDALIARRFRR